MDKDLILKDLLTLRAKIEYGEKKLPDEFQWQPEVKEVYHSVCVAIEALEVE